MSFAQVASRTGETMISLKPAFRIAAATIALSVPCTSAAAQTWYAEMSGPAESPPNASPGTGFGLFSYNSATHLFSYNVNFSGLIGTTTAAHIHCCTATPFVSTAGVATMTPSFAGFPLGVMSGTFINTFDLTLASSWNPAYITANGGTPAGAEAAFISGINSGRAYFNIHSSFAGGGEIRGFLVVVPEPSTVILTAAGLLGLGVAARRRRQSA